MKNPLSLTLTLSAGVVLLSLPACVATPAHRGLAATTPVFSPAAFFEGTTVGEGTLKVALSGTEPTHVRSRGRVEPDGTLVLVQRIVRGDGPPRERTWRMVPEGRARPANAERPAEGDRFSGSLTDARGEIAAYVRGNLLHIRYTTADGGLDTEQWLYLQPGGRVALNRMVVRKLGLPVASLKETITKRD